MNTAIVWFRKTIRIHDNPMLMWAESSQQIDSVIPIYIIDENWSLDVENSVGVNRLNFLYESLLDLDKNLKDNFGTKLLVYSGDSNEVIKSIIGSIDENVNSLLIDYCSEPKNRKDGEGFSLKPVEIIDENTCHINFMFEVLFFLQLHLVKKIYNDPLKDD